MLLNSLDAIAGTDRDCSGDGWKSRRFLRKSDGMGFSLHDTVIEPGAEMTLWYKHHLEANLCVEGSGEVVDLATGETHAIAPGTMYSLDKHDRHIVRSATGMRLVCVFYPALSGLETHDAEGSYEADGGCCLELRGE